MKVVKTGKTYMIYGDDLQTFDSVPAKVYTVECSKMTGFYLKEHAPLEVGEEKIYGDHEKKIEKVMNMYPEFERNLGVILSGAKGMGKSLFARALGAEAVKREMPVVLVEKYIPGLASFIETIEQEIVVIFDEFDKTYGGIKQKSGEGDPQAELLTLFDGMAMGKKMYVITANKTNDLNDYIINRPGRFHYHIRFEYPNANQVREYLTDKLRPEFYDEIPNVVMFCNKVKVNYDTLRSIAFELNHGLPFKEAILDLNVLHTSNETYDITLELSDGTRITRGRYFLNLFGGNQEEDIYFDFRKYGCSTLKVTYKSNDIKEDHTSSGMYVSADDFTFEYLDDDDNHMQENDSWAKPMRMTIERSKEKQLHYVL